jgi:hypothetical protein
MIWLLSGVHLVLPLPTKFEISVPGKYYSEAESTDFLLHAWCTRAGTVSSAIECKPIAEIMTSALKARIDKEGTSMSQFDVRALNIVRLKRYTQAAAYLEWYREQQG